jgi:hypothetical protein
MLFLAISGTLLAALLFGESFIVTHNTNKTLTGKYGKSPLFKINPDRKLTQNNFGKYTLQFSFYQILLEQAGFEVQSRVLVHLQEDEKTKKLYKTLDCTSNPACSNNI